MRLGSFLRAGAGTVVSQAIAFAALPFLFRLYQPSDFGPWAATLAIVSVVGGVATMRYDLAIVVERDPVDASALFWLSILLALLISTCGSLALIVGALRSWVVAGVPLASFGLSMALWLTITALSPPLQAWALQRGAFFDLSLAQVANAVVVNVVQLVGGAAGGGGRTLVVGSVMGQLALLGVLTYSVTHRSPAPASFRKCHDRMRAVALRHRRFPVFSAPFSFFSIARERASVIVLGIWASATSVGLYSQTWRLMSVPVGVTGSAIRPVIFHASAEQGLAAQERQVNRILFLLVVVGSPWLAILTFHTSELFAMILGHKWRDAGPLAAVMGAPFMLFVMSNWMDRILDVAGRQDLNLLTECISAVTATVALAVTLAAGWSIPSAVTIQCVILAVNYASFIVIAYRVAGYRLLALGRLAVIGALEVAVFAALLRILAQWAPYSVVLAVVGVVATALGGASSWWMWRRMR